MRKYIINADVLLTAVDVSKDEGKNLIQAIKAALNRGDDILIYHQRQNSESETRLKELLDGSVIDELKAITGEKKNSIQIEAYESEADLQRLTTKYLNLGISSNSDTEIIALGQLEADKSVNRIIDQITEDKENVNKLSYAVDSFANIQPAIGANIAITALQLITLLENEETFKNDYEKIESAIHNDQTRKDVSKFESIEMPPLRLDQNLNPVYFRVNIIDPDSTNLDLDELKTLTESLSYDDKLFPTIILSNDEAVKQQFDTLDNVFVIGGDKKEALNKFPTEIEPTGMAKIESLNIISNDSELVGRSHEKFLAAVTSVSIENVREDTLNSLGKKPDYEANVSFGNFNELNSFITESKKEYSSSVKGSISKSIGENIPESNSVHKALREAKLSKLSNDLELMGRAMGLEKSVRQEFSEKFIAAYKKYNTLVGERPSAVRSNLTESVFDYIAIGASFMNGLSGLLKGLFPNTAGVAFAGESSSSSIKVGANLLNLYAKLKKFESKGLAVLLKDYNKALGKLMQSPGRKEIAPSIALIEAFMLKSNLTKFSGLASEQSTNDGTKAAFWNVMAAVGSVTSSITAALKSKDLGIEKANQIAAWGSIASRAVNIYSSLSLFAQDVRIREFLQGIKINTDRTISTNELNNRLTGLVESDEIKEIISEFEKLKKEKNPIISGAITSVEEDIELGRVDQPKEPNDQNTNQSLLAPYSITIESDNIRDGLLLTISGELWRSMEKPAKERLFELLKNNQNIQVKLITDIRGTSSVASGEDATLSRLLPYNFKANLKNKFSAGNWDTAHLDKNGKTPKSLVYYGIESDSNSPMISRWFQQINQDKNLNVSAVSVKFSETPKTAEIGHHDFSEFLGYLENAFEQQYITQIKKEQQLGADFIQSESLLLPHTSKIPSRSEFTDRVTILDADNYEIESNDLSIIMEGFNERRINHPDKDHYIILTENKELQDVVEAFNEKEKQHVYLMKEREGVFDRYKSLLPLKDRTRIGSVSLFTNDKGLTNDAYSNLFGLVNVHTTNSTINNRAQIETSLRELIDLLPGNDGQNQILEKVIGKNQPVDLHAVGVKSKIDFLVKMMKLYYNSEELGKKVFKFRDQNISFYDYMKALKKEVTASPTQINQLTDRFLLVAAALVVLKQPRLDILPALIGIMGSPKSVYFNNYLKTGKMQSKANKLLAQVFTSSMVESLKLYPDKSYHYCAQMAIAQVMVERPQTTLMMAAGKVDRKKDKKFTERTAWTGFVAGALGTFVPFGIITRKEKELEGNRRLMENAMSTLNKVSSLLSSPEAMSGLASMAFNATQSTPDNAQEENELQKLTTNLNRITGMVIFGAVIITVIGNYVQARYFNQKFKDQGRQMDKLDKDLSKSKDKFNKNVREYIPVVRKRALNTITDLLENIIEGRIEPKGGLDSLRQLSQIGMQSKLEEQIKDLIDVLNSSKELLSIDAKETVVLSNTQEPDVITGESFNVDLNSEIAQTISILKNILENGGRPQPEPIALLKEKKLYFEGLDASNEERLWAQTDQFAATEQLTSLIAPVSNVESQTIALGTVDNSRTSGLLASDSDVLSFGRQEIHEATPLFSRMAIAQNLQYREMQTQELTATHFEPIDLDTSIRSNQSVSSGSDETKSKKAKAKYASRL